MKLAINKNWTKSLFLFPLAATLMGNQQSCQKQPAAQHRALKKIIELEKISSRPVNLGPSGTFDFEFVANQQIIDVLLSSDKYAFRLQGPVQSNILLTTGAGGLSKISVEQKSFNLSPSDQQLMKSWASTATPDKPAVLATESKEAWCMVNNPQAVISGSVNSFEMLGGGGLSIGFTPTGDHNFSLASANFQMQVFQLDLSMHAASPMTGTALASSNVTSNQTKTNISLGINLGNFTLGPSFYYSLPLAAVTKKGLQSAVNGLNADLDKAEWYTRVLANKDTDLVIVGGSNVNLKVGDELAMYNEIYYWTGEACNSQLQYDGVAVNPVAKGVVTSVGKELSVVKVTSLQEERVEIGATVKLVRFVEDIPAAPAAK